MRGFGSLSHCPFEVGIDILLGNHIQTAMVHARTEELLFTSARAAWPQSGVQKDIQSTRLEVLSIVVKQGLERVR